VSLTFDQTTHRYRLDRKPVPSVTGLIKGGLPKDSLMYWSAKTVAEYVAENRDAVESLWDMGREPMVQALKSVPWQKRNEAAARGTEVHAIAEQIIHGEEVDVPSHVAGHVRGYLDFLERFDVQPVLTECSVAHRPLWYAGRFDLIADMTGGRWFLDLKTSTSIYGETALQLAAYAGAEFYVTDDDPDTEHPMPDVDRFGVLHVTEYGTSLYPMRPAFRDWCAVLQVAKRRKKIDAHKLPEITSPEELESA
jgi:hypothetical protein